MESIKQSRPMMRISVGTSINLLLALSGSRRKFSPFDLSTGATPQVFSTISPSPVCGEGVRFSLRVRQLLDAADTHAVILGLRMVRKDRRCRLFWYPLVSAGQFHAKFRRGFGQ